MKKEVRKLLAPCIMLSLAACSNEQNNNPATLKGSSNTENSIQIDRYVSALKNGNGSKVEAILTADDINNLDQASENTLVIFNLLNRHLSSYFSKRYLDEGGDDNIAVVTAPLINTLPLFSLASAGTTKEQIDEHIPTFTIPKSLQANNVYKWKEGTLIKRAFLTQISSIIQPSMEVFSPNSDSSLYSSYLLGVLSATSKYQNNIVFSERGLNYSTIKGRYIKGNSVYEADMIQLKGSISVKTTEQYTAKRIELGNTNSFITLITPNEESLNAVISKLSTVLGEVFNQSDGFNVEHNSVFTLPIVSISDSKHAFEWTDIDTPLAFSEAEANLTQMGFSGFYFDIDMKGYQTVEIHSNRIIIDAEHSQSVNSSKNNTYYSQFNWTLAAYNDAIQGVDARKLLKPFEPDFKPSILLLHDNLGLIQAAIVIKKLDGTFAGMIVSEE